MRNNKKLGWKPDLPDVRDHLYSRPEMFGAEETPLPSSVDLRPLCSPIFDQSTLGSCSACAISGAMEFLEDKNKVATFDPLSQLYIYYNERAIEGTVSQDSGAQLRDGIKSLVNLGACSESLWPYDIKQFKKKPPAKAYLEGATRKITEYQRILTLDDMKHCIASGYPFVFGFTVYSSFMDEGWTKTGGIMPMPQPDDSMEGGHAQLAVGFDDEKQCILVRNSWGPNWNPTMGGYYWMPYAYISNPHLARDAWKIIK